MDLIVPVTRRVGPGPSRRRPARPPRKNTAAPNPAAGRQAVRHRLDRGQRVLRDQHRHELPGRVLDRGPERNQDQRQHEQHADHGADRARGVPDDGAQAEADQPDQGRVGTGHQHGAQHARLAEGGVRGRALEHRLADAERDEGQDLPRHQRHRGDDRRLGGQYQRAARRGGERGTDHAGGELAGHRQHAEDSEGELADGQPGVAVVGRVEGGAVGGRHGGPVLVDHDQDGQADQAGREDEQGPPRGPDAAQLQPLHLGHGAEAVMPFGLAGGPGQGRGGHETLLRV